HWFYQCTNKSLKEKQIRRAYQDAAGFVPPNFMDCPIVQRQKPSSSKDMNTTNEPLKDFSGLKQIANTESLNASVASKSNKGEGPPLITGDKLKHLTEEWTPKYFDVDKQIIKSPWKSPEVEKRMAMFTDVTGLGDVAFLAPVQSRRDLITNPDAFINFSIEMSAKIIELQKENHELKAKLHEAGVRHLKSA